MQKLELIRRYHHINRMLTLAIMILIILVSLLMWQFDLVLEGSMAVRVGAILMLGAVVVFRLPQISFQIWKRRYRNELAEYPLLALNWRDFRDEIQRRV